jgi:ribulose-phosphate 3-epimerase
MRAFLQAGAGRLVVHIESTSDISGLIDELEKTYGRDKELSTDLLSLGLSIQIDTPLSKLEAHLPRVDYVQFMGIAHIGRQGIPFDERVLGKIKEFKKAHSDMLIQVDGGVSLESAPALFDAGADRLVVGSALWKSEDMPGTLHAFDALAEQYGRYR